MMYRLILPLPCALPVCLLLLEPLMVHGLLIHRQNYLLQEFYNSIRSFIVLRRMMEIL